MYRLRGAVLVHTPPSKKPSFFGRPPPCAEPFFLDSPRHICPIGHNVNGPQQDKPLFWIGSSRSDLKDCRDDVQDVVRYALHWAQRGGKSPDAKPLQGLAAPGCSKSWTTLTATPTVPSIRCGLPERFTSCTFFRRNPAKG